MSSILVAVVIALVLGHMAASLVALRQFGWFADWRGWLQTQFGASALWRGRWGGLLSAGIPAALVGLLAAALSSQWFGVPLFVLSVATLFYAWGPHDLDRDVDRIVHAEGLEARRLAAAQIHPEASVSWDGPSLVEAVFAAALARWFGVLLWFLLLGPMGAIGYRLVALAARDEALPAAQREGLAGMRLALDWPAAQLMTLALALVANFDTVLAAWREWLRDGWRLDIGFLYAAARASVNCELAVEASDADEPASESPALLALRDAMSLVWRILLVWLAILALFVLAGWVN